MQANKSMDETSDDSSESLQQDDNEDSTHNNGIADNSDIASESEEEESEDCSESESDSGNGDNNEEGNASEEDYESEEGEESEGSSEEGSESDNPQPVRRVRHAVSEQIESDDSDGQSEKCPICLSHFISQEIGSPESCDHTFCLECITEWSRTMNTCPSDRRVFTFINVRKTLTGKIVRQVSVQKQNAAAPVEEEDPTNCQVCGRSDREDRLLLCDGCDMGFHLECLNPPLANVPVEEWFCPDCAAENYHDLAEEVAIEEGELLSLFNEVNPTIAFPLLRQRNATRLLPRTRQSEVVRRRIQRTRATRPVDVDQPSTSSADSPGERPHLRLRIYKPKATKAVKRRKTVKRRRKPTKKRKTATTRKRKTTSSGEPKKKKRRRYRRKKTRKPLRKVKIIPSATPQSRLAEQLGVKKMLPNHFFPVMQEPVGSRTARPRHSEMVMPSLRLFGQRNELYPFSDDNDEGGDTAVLRVVPALRNGTRHGKSLSASALLSHRPVASSRRSVARIISQVPSPASATSQSFDILGSILSEQNRLTLTSKDVIIKRDGTLRTTQAPASTANGARQRPVDPVQGTHNKNSGRQKEGDSSNLPSKGNEGRASYSSHGSSATSEEKSGRYQYSDHNKSSGEDSGHASSNYGRTNASASNKKHEKRAEKEVKKQSEDEDIDIYSDIEPGIENEGDDNTLDQVAGLDDLTMADGNSPISDDMTDSQHNQVDGDCNGDVGNCSDAGSDDDLVIDESVKHDEDASDGEGSEKNFRTAKAGDESEDNGLVIDEAEEESEDNASERGPVSPPSPKPSMDVDDVSTYEDDDNKADDPTSQDPYPAGDGDCEEIPEIESCSESEQAEKSERGNFSSIGDNQQNVDNSNEESDGENQANAEEDEDQEEEPEEVEDEEQEEQEEDQDGVQEEEQEEAQEEEESYAAENECEKSNNGENAYENESEDEQNENATEEVGEGEGEEEEAEEEEEEEGAAAEEGGEEDQEQGHEEEMGVEKDSYPNEEEIEQSCDDENQNEEDEARSAGLEPSTEGQESGAEFQESGAEDGMEHEEGEGNALGQEEIEEGGSANEADIHVTAEVSEGGMEGTENEQEIASPNDGAFLRPSSEAGENELPAEEGEIEERENVRRRKLRNSGFPETSGSSRRRGSPSRFRRRRGSRDYEEGEIVEDTPPRKSKSSRKSRTSRNESPDYDTVPRINISELPRIPKIKRDKPGKDRTEACSQEGSNSSAMPSGNGGGAGPNASVNNSALESKRTSVMARLDTGSTTDICWKKLSQNTKTRNYRDSKPKGESKHFRQREGREAKEAGEKRSASNSASVAPTVSEDLKKREAEVEKEKERKERERDIDYYAKNAEVKEYPRSKERSHDKRSSSKHEKEKHKEKHRDKHKSEKHKEYKEKHKHGGSSSSRPRDASLEKVKERGYEKYEKIAAPEKLDKKEKKEQKREKMRKELERIHREEKHREHKKREKEKEKEKVMAITNLALPSREASPIEMKEVYASGDSIIVNVNFSRPPGKENALKEGKSKEEKTPKIKDKEHVESRERKKQRSVDGDGYPKEKTREKSSKRREMEEHKRDSKRQKYGHDDLRMTHREIIVKSRESRGWGQFREDSEDLRLMDNDQKSVASDASVVIADDSTNAGDLLTDSDDDVVEIEPEVGGVDESAPLEGLYKDEASQSADEASVGGDDFCNYDSNSNDPVPCSPPSPAEENSVYDPFEPTKSPSPILSPEPSPPVPPGAGKAENPEPPPLPALPPLPPEPEPDAPSPPNSSSESPPATSLLQTVPTSTPTSVSVTLAPASSVSQSRTSPQTTTTTSTPIAMPVPTRPPHCMPPPISMPNIRVPPPNYIPRTMQPGTTQLSPLRPMGWSVGTPNLLFPPTQQQIMQAAGNFLTPPPTLAGQGGTASQQSVTLTQIGSLLHTQAAQLAMLSSVRPPPAGMPPHMGIAAILHPHGTLPQQFTQASGTAFGLTQNGETKRPPQQDTTEVVDMDVDSPYSPGDTLDPADSFPQPDNQKEPAQDNSRSRDRFDSLLGSVQSRKENVPAKTSEKGAHKGRGHGTGSKGAGRQRDDRRRSEAQRKHIVRFEVPDRQAKGGARGGKDKKAEEGKKEVTVKMDETQLKILDELPSSAVEMQVKEKFLKKLNRQERVIEEVKLAIKPYYNRREINKDEYKEILRKSVPKICHNKSGEINPVKIKALVEGYVKKFKYHRKRESKVGTSKKS